MALGTKVLKARLELVGGEKLERQFREIGQEAERAMDRIDREAAKASREVKELERELARLKAISKSIRASIVIDEKKGATSHQKNLLAFADGIDKRVAAAGKQASAIRDALDLGKGRTVASMAQGFDPEMLKARKAVDAIGKAVENARKQPSFKGWLDDFKLDEVEGAAARVQAASERFNETIRDGYQRAIDAEAKDRADLIERARKAEAKREADEREEALKAEEKAERRKEQAEKKARRQKEQAAREELKRLEEERKAVDALNAEWADVERDARRRERSEKERHRDLKRRHREMMGLTDPSQKILKIPEGAPTTIEALRKQEAEKTKIAKQALEQREKDAAASAERKRKLEEKAANDVAKWTFQHDKEQAEKREKDEKARLDAALKRRVDFHKKLDANIKSIGDGFKKATADVEKFVGSLGRIAPAAGKVAFRGGVAGLVGGLGAGIGALGAGAAWGGIAAGAGLAAFDGHRMKQAAEMAGMAIEQFTALRYAAGQSGVAFDDFNESMVNFNDLLGKSADGHEDAEDAAKWLKMMGIQAKKADGSVIGAGEALSRIADVFRNMRDGAQKTQIAKDLGIEEMIPLLNRGGTRLAEMVGDAQKLGVVLSKTDATTFDKLRESLWGIWEAIRGVGYELARQIAPILIPMLQAVVVWIAKNRTAIANWLVDAFKYLTNVGKQFWKAWTESGAWEKVKWFFVSTGKVIADFWRLLTEGNDADTTYGWTKALYNGLVAVWDAIKLLWGAFSKMYEMAKPYLDKLGEALGLGPNSGLAVVIGFLISKLLGVSDLFMAMGAAAKDGIGSAGSIIGSLMKFIAPVLLGLGGIIGWPALLAGGVALVATYWEDIKKLFSAAWDLFKETFPETASWLEDGFGKAKGLVTQFLDGMIAEFKAKYPNLYEALAAIGRLLATVFGEGFKAVQDAPWLEALKGVLSVIEKIVTAIDKWIGVQRQIGEYLGGTFVTALQTISQWLQDAGAKLEKFFGLEPGPGWLKLLSVMGVPGMLASAGVRALGYGGTGAPAAAAAPVPAFATGGRVRGPGSGTSDSILARLSNGEFVNTARAVRFWGTDFFERINRLEMPIPGFASGGLVEVAGAGGTPIMLDLGNGDRIQTVSREADLERRLSRSNRAAIGRRPNWMR